MAIFQALIANSPNCSTMARSNGFIFCGSLAGRRAKTLCIAIGAEDGQPSAPFMALVEINAWFKIS